jgi:hypothetical protein
MMRRILAILGLVVVGLAIAVVTGWGALVLFYLAHGGGVGRGYHGVGARAPGAL